MLKKQINIIEKAKPSQIERLKKLMSDEKDWKDFCEISNASPINSIRVNTLKISINELKNRLGKKWKISQPFKSNPEIIIVEDDLMPGELGKSIEHILGYYYIQDIASMMPVISLNPKEDEIILDLCAAPGSKTTQLSMMMENKGTIIANDENLGRIGILSTNLQRCGVTNTVVTRENGNYLCKSLDKLKFKFDKILVDAPCSGEGTIRSSPQSVLMFSENLINNLSRIQKSLLENAVKIIKEGGEIVYSTCTHSPEENEGVVSYILDKYPEIQIEEIKLPLKIRNGITNWNGIKYNSNVKKCARIYPQDNNTEGFFIAKLKRVK